MKQQTGPESDDERSPLKARLLSRAMRTKPLFQTALWTQMPLLAMAGPDVTELEDDRCVIEIPYRWRTRNIFGNMYFAASLMAAEATTGGLVFYHHLCRPEDCSFIVTGVEADFVDKAESRVRFECRDGDVVSAAFDEAAASGESVRRTLQVVGRREDGTETARVDVEWSWKAK